MTDNNETYGNVLLGDVLSKMKKNKPIYVLAAYNYYRLKRVVEYDDFIILESWEENGCWSPDTKVKNKDE